jgi:hypothetical protein
MSALAWISSGAVSIIISGEDQLMFLGYFVAAAVVSSQQQGARTDAQHRINILREMFVFKKKPIIHDRRKVSLECPIQKRKHQSQVFATKVIKQQR